MTPRELVQALLDAGFRLCFWKADVDGKGDAKGPREENWTTRKYTIDDYHDGDRVGIMTGTEISPGQFIADVDLDWQPGSLIAQNLLPPTLFVFGRASKRVSHCVYTTEAPAVSFRYEDPIDKVCLIELRGTKNDGSVGLESMCPPSIWSKDGKQEQLTFVRGAYGAATSIPLEVLKRQVALAATGMLLAKHLGVNGYGHESRLMVAGFLLRAGVPPEDLIKMGEAMSTYCNNTEIADVRRAVESTVAGLADTKKKIKGGPALAKHLGPNGKKIVARINEWLGKNDDRDGEVIMRGGDLSKIVDQAEDALLQHSTIYQRGGVLTRPIRLDRPLGAAGDVRREIGSAMVIKIHEAWLLEEMGKTLTWYVPEKDGGKRRTDPAPVYARTLINRGEWKFHALRAVVTAPTLDRDGRIVNAPGFDSATGLLLDFHPDDFPPIPTTPTLAEAMLALDLLQRPLRGFPFVDDAARAVALSAILTGLVRSSLRTSPLHGFDASTAGTGKSLLAEAAGLIATGVRPPALSQGKSEEEDEKRLSTVLFAGDPVIHIDNCERAISGDFLCSMLTQTTLQARILGQSERRILPSTALVLASGNNLTFAGDTSRRAVICRLDAGMERPDQRVFDFDCHEEIIAGRPELVVAGLTILRAYVVAGRPAHLTPMGSFNDWEWIRGALVWLGCADPANTRTAILENDPRKDDLLVVMDLWAKAFGDVKTGIAEVGKDATGDEVRLDLQQKLIEVACRGGKWNAKSVGWWLRRNKERVLEHRCFKSEASMVGAQMWQLVGGAEPGPRRGAEDVPF